MDKSEDMMGKRSRAEEELFEMWKRSSLPQVPPFVKMPQGKEKPPEPPPREDPEPPKVSDPSFQGEKKGIGGLLSKDIFKFLDLKNFELNSDRMLILLMIVLLSGEDSDNILLFALAYIML